GWPVAKVGGRGRPGAATGVSPAPGTGAGDGKPIRPPLGPTVPEAAPRLCWYCSWRRRRRSSSPGESGGFGTPPVVAPGWAGTAPGAPGGPGAPGASVEGGTVVVGVRVAAPVVVGGTVVVGVNVRGGNVVVGARVRVGTVVVGVVVVVVPSVG